VRRASGRTEGRTSVGTTDDDDDDDDDEGEDAPMKCPARGCKLPAKKLDRSR
jgi:hypothetical protein